MPLGFSVIQNGPFLVLWLYEVGSFMGSPAVVAQVVERECCHGGVTAISGPQVRGFHAFSFAQVQLVTQLGCP